MERIGERITFNKPLFFTSMAVVLELGVCNKALRHMCGVGYIRGDGTKLISVAHPKGVGDGR